ncbi:unnamed protein product [Leptosia nina]|uniref:Uncharacterized protein n=1 Tax=Leptosia nina TaxID=320188 RepID=A0AAV1JB16_9NEOP
MANSFEHQTPFKGRCYQEQPEQATPRATQRRAGHLGFAAPLRAEHPQQAGPSFHTAALRQLLTHQKLLPR